MSRTQRALRFAWLGLLVACGRFGGSAPWALAGERPGPAVTVVVEYPGASARVVADTVAAPIEQQVNGVENMRWMRSRSSNDGSYTLTIAFRPGTDLNMAQVLVQNRVALALPMLPDAVKGHGVTVMKKSGVLAIVTLFSPDGRYDGIYLSNYATIQIRDELARLPGVGDVTLLGQRDYGMWVRLDPAKMSARNLTVSDVVEAIKAEKALRDRQRAQGDNVETFGSTIVKTDAQGAVVRLRDVGAIELGGPERSPVVRQGKSAVALVIHTAYPGGPRTLAEVLRGKPAEPGPRTLRDALQKRLSDESARSPEGVASEIAFDFTANLEAPEGPTAPMEKGGQAPRGLGASPLFPEYLLVDVALPATDSTQRTRQVLERCEAMVRKTAGVQDALALSENPLDAFGARACVLVRLAPAGGNRASREQLVQTIRTGLAQVEGIAVGVRDLSRPGGFPRCGYPVDLAIEDRGSEPERLKEFSRKLTERLRKSNKLTDLWSASESKGLPQLEIHLDRDALRRQNVRIEEFIDTELSQISSRSRGEV